MIYISKLEIENFQSHKYTLLDFDKGLNVIVGNSDSGKTAIIRAIKWALYNEPQGDYFIRQGEKNISVSVYFNTGAIVKRYRSPSKNGYYLKKSDGEESSFEGFGRTIPKDILEEINIYKINLNESTYNMLNISEQLEGPFLLNETNPVRASAIGRLVGVNFIDDALRDTRTDANTTNRNIKTLEEKRESLSEDLKKFDYLAKEEKILAELKKLKSDLDSKTLKYNSLVNLLKEFENVQLEIAKEQSIIEKHKNIDDISDIYDRLHLEYFRFKSLTDIRESSLFNDKEIDTNEKLIKSLENLSLYENTIEEINEKIKFYRKMVDYRDKYQLCRTDIDKQNKILNKLNNLSVVEEISNQINDFFKRLNILQGAFSNYKDLSNRIEIGNKFCLKYEHLDEVEDILKTLNEALNKYNSLITNKTDLDSLMNDITQCEEEYSKFDEMIKTNYRNYQNELLHIGQCPLCFSKIDHEVIENIRKRYVEE